MPLTEDGGTDLEGLAGDRLDRALPAGYEWLHVNYRDTSDHEDKLPAAARPMLHLHSSLPGSSLPSSGRADVRSAPDTH